ncbi:hypothetical protein GCM10027052_07570 [Parafrigoribacterium mesophilum]
MVGSAALSTVELRAERNMASMRPTNMRMRPRLVSCDARAGVLVLRIWVVVIESVEYLSEVVRGIAEELEDASGGTAR